MTPQRIENLLTSGRVIRYHAAPSVAPQTLDSHCWGVASLVWYLSNGLAPSGLLAESLFHDSGELSTGDIPFTVKRECPELKAMVNQMDAEFRINHGMMPATLRTVDTQLLKLADSLEGFIWCCQHEPNGPVLLRWSFALSEAYSKFEFDLTMFYSTAIPRAQALQQHYHDKRRSV